MIHDHIKLKQLMEYRMEKKINRLKQKHLKEIRQVLPMKFCETTVLHVLFLSVWKCLAVGFVAKAQI